TLVVLAIIFVSVLPAIIEAVRVRRGGEKTMRGWRFLGGGGDFFFVGVNLTTRTSLPPYFRSNFSVTCLRKSPSSISSTTHPTPENVRSPTRKLTCGFARMFCAQLACSRFSAIK